MTYRIWPLRPPGGEAVPSPLEATGPIATAHVTPPAPRSDGNAKPKPPAVRYVGFRTTDQGREYTCRVNDGLGERRFVLFIGHQAFASREARFQDAPDLCCARLQRELAADPGLLPGSPLALTAEELLDYRNVREHRAPGRKRRGSTG